MSKDSFSLCWRWMTSLLYMRRRRLNENVSIDDFIIAFSPRLLTCAVFGKAKKVEETTWSILCDYSRGQTKKTIRVELCQLDDIEPNRKVHSKTFLPILHFPPFLFSSSTWQLRDRENRSRVKLSSIERFRQLRPSSLGKTADEITKQKFTIHSVLFLCCCSFFGCLCLRESFRGKINLPWKRNFFGQNCEWKSLCSKWIMTGATYDFFSLKHQSSVLLQQIEAEEYLSARNFPPKQK